MYQHLEDLYNSEDLYFPSDQCMMLLNLFKVQGKPMDFNVIEQELIDMVSDSTLQLIFKKLPCVVLNWVIGIDMYTLDVYKIDD